MQWIIYFVRYFVVVRAVQLMSWVPFCSQCFIWYTRTLLSFKKRKKSFTCTCMFWKRIVRCLESTRIKMNAKFLVIKKPEPISVILYNELNKSRFCCNAGSIVTKDKCWMSIWWRFLWKVPDLIFCISFLSPFQR